MDSIFSDISLILLRLVFVFMVVCCIKEVSSKMRKKDGFSSYEKYHSADNNSQVSVFPMPEYDRNEVEENYYRLSNQLEIPSDCMRIDMETTVLGFPCRTKVNGQYFNYGFYCWVADDTLYIFPTEDHLKRNYIAYSMTLYGKDIFKSNDIPLYKIKKSEMIYYKVVGEIHSEKQVITKYRGQYARDEIIGRMVTDSPWRYIDIVDDKNRYYTRVRKIDERDIELSYYDGKQSHSIILGFGVYPFLKQKFPDKEYDCQEKKQKVSLDKRSVET